MKPKVQEMYVGVFGFEDKYFKAIYTQDGKPIAENYETVDGIVNGVIKHYKNWQFTELKIYGLINDSSTPAVKPISIDQHAELKLTLETEKRINGYSFSVNIDEQARREQDISFNLTHVVNE